MYCWFLFTPSQLKESNDCHNRAGCGDNAELFEKMVEGTVGLVGGTTDCSE